MRHASQQYAATHHKYTINLPIELMKQAHAKSRAAGFSEVAPYIRAILSRQIPEAKMTLQDIIGEREIKRLGWEKILSDNQRRVIQEYSFIRLSAKNFIDKVRKLSVYFNRSKDQQFFEF